MAGMANRHFVKSIPAGTAVAAETNRLLTRARASTQPMYWKMSASDARALFVRQCRSLAGEPIAISRVVDLAVPVTSIGSTVRLRAYCHADSKSFPLLIYFHGGGWVVGGLEEYDAFARRLATELGCHVVMAEYPLAPEHKFPEAVLFASRLLEAAASVAQAAGLDATEILVGGDSAGANLAICGSLSVSAAFRPSAQLLLYPVVDLRPNTFHAIDQEVLLDDKTLQWFIDQYLGAAANAFDPRASVLLHPALALSPATVVVTAGFDIVAEQGHLLSERIAAAGAAVSHLHCEGMVHGFLNMVGALPSALSIYSEIREAMSLVTQAQRAGAVQ